MCLTDRFSIQHNCTCTQSSAANHKIFYLHLDLQVIDLMQVISTCMQVIDLKITRQKSKWLIKKINY